MWTPSSQLQLHLEMEIPSRMSISHHPRMSSWHRLGAPHPEPEPEPESEPDPDLRRPRCGHQNTGLTSFTNKISGAKPVSKNQRVLVGSSVKRKIPRHRFGGSRLAIVIRSNSDSRHKHDPAFVLRTSQPATLCLLTASFRVNLSFIRIFYLITHTVKR